MWEMELKLRFKGIKRVVFTFEYKYLKKKSNKNDFPFRNAPATEITTTFRSRISFLSSIFDMAGSSNLNAWSSVVTTIGIAWPDIAFLISAGLGPKINKKIT